MNLTNNVPVIGDHGQLAHRRRRRQRSMLKMKVLKSNARQICTDECEGKKSEIYT